MITRACLRSAAMIMTVPISPGPKGGRQSLEGSEEDRDAREDERLAGTSAAHQPCLVQRLCRRCATPGVLAVERELLLASSAARTAQRGTHATRPTSVPGSAGRTLWNRAWRRGCSCRILVVVVLKSSSQQRMVKRLDVAVGLLQLGEYLLNALKLA